MTRDFFRVLYYKLPREYAETFTFLQKSYAIAEIIIFFSYYLSAIKVVLVCTYLIKCILHVLIVLTSE